MEVLFVLREDKTTSGTLYICSKVGVTSISSGAVEPGRVSKSEKVDVAAGLSGGKVLQVEEMAVRLASGLSERVLLENTDEGLREDVPGYPPRALLVSSSKYGGLG